MTARQSEYCAQLRARKHRARHGTMCRYWRGCRCGVCRRANTKYYLERRMDAHAKKMEL